MTPVQGGPLHGPIYGPIYGPVCGLYLVPSPPSDARFIALNKIAKLLYFASLHEGLVAHVSGPNGLGGAGGAGGVRTVAVEALTITPPSLTLDGPRGGANGRHFHLRHIPLICSPPPRELTFPIPLTHSDHIHSLPKPNTHGLVEVVFPGFSAGATVLPGMAELVTFFQSIRPFYYASNSGAHAQVGLTPRPPSLPLRPRLDTTTCVTSRHP